VNVDAGWTGIEARTSPPSPKASWPRRQLPRIHSPAFSRRKTLTDTPTLISPL